MRNIKILCLLSGVMMFTLLFSCQSVKTYQEESDGIVLKGEQGMSLKISVLRNDLFHFQLAENGQFTNSLLSDFGFVKTSYPEVTFKVKESKKNICITTSALELEIRKDSLKLIFRNKDSKEILAQKNFFSSPSLKKLSFRMTDDEHFFGLGFMRKAFDARGHKLTWERGFRWEEATVPFFMSTKGYGFFSANTYRHDFDFTENDSYTIEAEKGTLDFYFMYGPGFEKIIDVYTDLTGKAGMIPKWTLGLQFRCRYMEDQQGVLATARKFRERNIPIEMMSLEPGWEEVPYSMKWEFGKQRFADPAGMIKSLADMGYKFDLWESGIAPFDNLSDPEVRKNWFAKRLPIIDMGVQMFKQDDPYPRSIVSVELEEGKKTKNRITDSKYDPDALLNIANSLYTETVFKEYQAHTGKRAVMTLNGYNASVSSQRWPFQWAADFQAKNGLLNASLSGHSLVAYDIRNPFPAGMHQGFLNPISIIDSWAYYREPWRYTPGVENSHRFYASLRSRLMPYIYTSLWQSHQTGVPVLRPMVLYYQNNPDVYDLTTQYFFGDYLLVGLPGQADDNSIARKDFDTGGTGAGDCMIYLPQGLWIDYWTGKEYDIEKGNHISVSWPAYAGGPLFVKAGGIIPMGQVKNYIEEKEDEIVVLDIFPHLKSSYSLYEDDGVSGKYEEGAFALTPVTCVEKKNKVDITIGPRTGSYDNMPEDRSYLLKVHSLKNPRKVLIGEQEIPGYEDGTNLLFNAEKDGWYYDSVFKKVVIKVEKSWQFAGKADNLDPAGTLPLTSAQESIIWKGKSAISSKQVDVQLIFGREDPVTDISSANPLEKAGAPALHGRIVAQANPPEKVNLPSGGNWLPKYVSVYGYIETDGQLNKDATNTIVLKVYDNKRVLLKTLETKSKEGEFIFRNVEYDKRPEKYYFELSSSGLEGTEIKIFENTWNK